MIKYLPNIKDDKQHYMLVPMGATLYGRDLAPFRWLRVVPEKYSGRTILTFENEAGNPDSLTIVETVDIKNFIKFVTYGYSTYTECALSGFESNLKLSNHKELILSQATLRSYSNRCKILIDLCKRKKYSLTGAFTNNTKTGELVDELDGALAMWELFMNTGSIKPADCLRFIPGRMSTTFIPLARFESSYENLSERQLVNNFVDMRFKIPNEDRIQLLNALGIEGL